MKITKMDTIHAVGGFFVLLITSEELQESIINSMLGSQLYDACL